MLAIHNGKIVFRRFLTANFPGCGDPKPSIYLKGNLSFEDGDSEISEIGRRSLQMIQTFEDKWTDTSSCTKDLELCDFGRHKKSSSAEFCFENIVQQRAGWPLLRAESAVSSLVQEVKERSVVSWVMNLPNRSVPGTPGSNSSLESIDTEIFHVYKGDYDDISKGSLELPEALELLKTNSSSCRWFSHEILRSSTSKFSSGHFSNK